MLVNKMDSEKGQMLEMEKVRLRESWSESTSARKWGA